MSEYLADNLKRSKRNLIATSAGALAIQSFGVTLTSLPTGVGNINFPERFVPIILGVSVGYFLLHFAFYAYQEWIRSRLSWMRVDRSTALQRAMERYENNAKMEIENVLRDSGQFGHEEISTYTSVLISLKGRLPSNKEIQARINKNDGKLADQLYQVLDARQDAGRRATDSFNLQFLVLTWLEKASGFVDWVIPLTIGALAFISTVWPSPFRDFINWWLGNG